MPAAALIAVPLFKIAASDGPRRTILIFKATAALAVWVTATIGLPLITVVAAYALMASTNPRGGARRPVTSVYTSATC